MNELEHRIFHDEYREKLDRNGCHYGQLLNQTLVNLENLQKVVRDRTLPRIADRADDANKKSERAMEMSEKNETGINILNNKFDSAWWKLMLAIVGANGFIIIAGVFILKHILK